MARKHQKERYAPRISPVGETALTELPAQARSETAGEAGASIFMVSRSAANRSMVLKSGSSQKYDS